LVLPRLHHSADKSPHFIDNAVLFTVALRGCQDIQVKIEHPKHPLIQKKIKDLRRSSTFFESEHGHIRDLITPTPRNSKR